MAISSAASTRAALAAAYKELFPDKRLEQTALMDRDIMKWLPKADDLEGDGIHIPIRYGMPQGGGANFGQGQANVTSGKVKRTFIERNKYYGFVSIDDEAVRSSRSKKGAFYGVKEVEIEDMIQNIAQRLETHLWRDGSGALGTVSSVSGGVVTLTNPEDVANFQIGAPIAALEGATTVARNDTVTAVTGVDSAAGTITFADDKDDGDAWAANDRLVLCQLGYTLSATDLAVTTGISDYENVVSGLSAWIPATAETSGTFLGMDRTDDVDRLQGFRQGYIGSIEETIKKLRSRMGRYSARPDSIWLSHDNWHRLELELGSRAVRDDGSAATFGLPTIKYSSPKGVMKVYAGAFCEEDVGYLLRRDSWKIHHLDGLPHLIMSDGLRSTRGQDYDGIEVRARYWAELACDSPFHNGRFVIG
jgi:hypothetical protein